jgi:hypothetical protein
MERKNLTLRGKKYKEAGQNYIMRSFTIWGGGGLIEHKLILLLCSISSKRSLSYDRSIASSKETFIQNSI